MPVQRSLTGRLIPEVMERRKSQRIPIEMNIEIDMYVGPYDQWDKTCHGEPITALVKTIDISLCGLSVRIVHSPTDTERSFSPGISYTLIGKTVTADFRDYNMMVAGKVVRVDPATMLIAVVITKVSDISCWRRLCGQTIYEQSCG